MFLLRRLLPLIVTTVVSACLALFAFRPHAIYGLFPDLGVFSGVMLGAALMVMSLGMLGIGSYHPMKSRFRFMYFPILLVVSVMTTLSFLEQRLVIWLAILFTAASLWLWYESLYTFWQQPGSYQPYTLQRLSAFLYVLATFWFACSLAGLYVYLQLRFVAAVAILIICLFGLFFDAFSLCQFEAKQALLAAGVCSVITLEVFLAVSYLPTQIFVQSLLMALAFYALVGLTKLAVQQELKRVSVMPYVVVTTLGLLLTIGSTLWIF